MNSRRLAVAVAVVGVVVSLAASASASGSGGEEGGWWNIPYPQRMDTSSLEMTLAPIRVEGNRFVDPEGETVVFRGVSISDPDKLNNVRSELASLTEVWAQCAINAADVENLKDEDDPERLGQDRG